jgi:hypothetical protein
MCHRLRTGLPSPRLLLPVSRSTPSCLVRIPPGGRPWYPFMKIVKESRHRG